MAYFSNGTEGESYQAQWCSRCTHQNGCPVWDAHLLYAYELCNSTEAGKHILDMLIPMRDDGFADKCLMFTEVTPEPVSVMPAMELWAKERGVLVK